MSGYIYASERFPCPLCRAKKDCRVRSETNAVFCHTHRDAYGAPSDYLWRGLSNNGVWGIWVHESDLGRGYDPDRPRHTPAPQKLPPTTTTGPSRFEKVHRDIQPLPYGMAEALADHLGLPASIARHFSYWQDHESQRVEQPWAWTLPEWGYDSRGNFLEVAIHLRYGDGTKRSHGNPVADAGHRGIYIPEEWDQGGPDTPLFLPEGASDTMALWAMGFSAVGRPNNVGGAGIVARWVAHQQPLDGRPIVVLAENDIKPVNPGEILPQWPGRDGGRVVAQQLADLLGRVVRMAYTPEGAKDVRQWYTAQANRPPVSPESLRQRFTDRLIAVELFEPRQNPKPAAAPLPLAPPPAPPAEAPTPPASGPNFLTAWTPPRDLNEPAVAASTRESRADVERFPCSCPRNIVLANRRTHCPHIQQVRCEKWTCPGCRLWLINRELLNCRWRFEAAAALHYLTVPLTDAAWQNLARCLRRAGANYFRLRCEAEGLYLVILDRPVQDAPAITPDDALQLVASHLNDWAGDRRPCSTSHGWRRAREEREPFYERLGIAHPRITPEDIRDAAVDVGAQAFMEPPSDPAGRTLRVYYFHRPAGWDVETRDRLARHLFAGEVIPELPDSLFEDATLPPGAFDWIPH
jgi:hypothetical protein